MKVLKWALAAATALTCATPALAEDSIYVPLFTYRTGAFTGGGGEEEVLQAATAQIARHFGLPGISAAGMTDAKRPDYQAGYEKGMTIAMSALAGVNMICESAGMMGSLMG